MPSVSRAPAQPLLCPTCGQLQPLHTVGYSTLLLFGQCASCRNRTKPRSVSGTRLRRTIVRA